MLYNSPILYPHIRSISSDKDEASSFFIDLNKQRIKKISEENQRKRESERAEKLKRLNQYLKEKKGTTPTPSSPASNTSSTTALPTAKNNTTPNNTPLNITKMQSTNDAKNKSKSIKNRNLSTNNNPNGVGRYSLQESDQPYKYILKSYQSGESTGTYSIYLNPFHPWLRTCNIS